MTPHVIDQIRGARHLPADAVGGQPRRCGRPSGTLPAGPRLRVAIRCTSPRMINISWGNHTILDQTGIPFDKKCCAIEDRIKLVVLLSHKVGRE
eukprot:4987248-Pyramimonas_sp.AAC.1